MRRVLPLSWSSLMAQAVKNPLSMQETQEMRIRSLDSKAALEEKMTIHSSILAWKIPLERSLAGYSPWGHKELDTAEHACIALSFQNLKPQDELEEPLFTYHKDWYTISGQEVCAEQNRWGYPVITSTSESFLSPTRGGLTGFNPIRNWLSSEGISQL